MFVNKGKKEPSRFFSYSPLWGISRKISIWYVNLISVQISPPPHPPFCLTSHFLVKSFRHPNLHQFWKSRTPILLLMKWGGLNHGMMFFSFEKVLNDQIYSSSDARHLIKKSTPSKISILPPLGGIFSPHLAFRKPLSVTYPGVFLHTVNYRKSGYMLNADGHLMD